MGSLKRFLVAGLLALTLFCTAAFGVVFYRIVVAYGENNEKENFLSRAVTAAALIDVAKVQSLSGVPDDQDRSEYAFVRSQLISLKKIDPDIRFLYIMKLKGDKIIFLIDAETPTSEDFSSPGDVYEDASPELFGIFKDKKPFIEGQLTDAWGRWVSAIAPLLTPDTQEVAGIVGFDIDSKRWDKNIFFYKAFGITIPVFLGIVICVFWAALFKVNSTNVHLLKEVTERKQIEKELRDSEDQLVRAKKMEAVGILAGGVAHDLNNVLSGISSYPELLLVDIPEDSSLRKPLLTIQRAGQKAGVIVQDLLTLARRGVAHAEVVNMNQLVDDFLNSPELEKLMSFHPGIEIKTQLDQELKNVKGSPVHISKTLMNLVSNAAEAIKDKGVVCITTENCRIETPLKGYENIEAGEYVVLTVSDSGQGLSSNDLEKVFIPFYTKKKMGRSGTGLGMAVVWGTVKDHNGFIDAHSNEGVGTSFILYFPITREKVPCDPPETSIEAYQGNGESILIVDDVVEQRRIAYEILRKLGYSPTAVSSGEEAVTYLSQNKVVLVILDMIMAPGMDGLETYKQILKINPGQKAIVTSGFSETVRVKELLGLGARQYIKKPYSLNDIGVAVKSALAN